MIFILLSCTVLIHTAHAAAQCSPTERSVWFIDQPFADKYDLCSRASFGAAEGTVDCLFDAYPSISRRCLTCFGAATTCGLEWCAMQCASNSADPVCLECINDHCSPALRTCVGAFSRAELPMTPTASTTTTARPRARRVTTTPAAAVVVADAETTTQDVDTTSTSTAEETSTSTSETTSTTTETTTTSTTEETTSTETSAESTTVTTAEITTPEPASDETTKGYTTMSLFASAVLVAVAALL